MATVSVSKVVLQHTSIISLDERFTAYQQQAHFQNAVSNARQKMRMQRQTSVQNRRLAQQMENRPSVMPALPLKKCSLQQRLGPKPNSPAPANPKSNVKSRLNLNARGNSSVQARSGGQRLNPDQNSNMVPRSARRNNGTVAELPGNCSSLGERSGSKNSTNRNFRSSYRPRGGGANFRRRGRNYNQGGSQSSVREHRAVNFAASNADGGCRGMKRKGVPTKQELDTQLDEYMAERKSHRDSQLDQYM